MKSPTTAPSPRAAMKRCAARTRLQAAFACRGCSASAGSGPMTVIAEGCHSNTEATSAPHCRNWRRIAFLRRAALSPLAMDVVSPAASPAPSPPAPARAPLSAVRPAPELSVVVPTFNERANIPILVERLAEALAGCDWEVLFVDDNSPDGTAALARALGAGDGRVRCMRRIGRRGLAGACLEGMLASQARYVAVMDADLQHDESLLLEMLQILRTASADLIVA